nr:NADH dehydrogenase subunit 6 [Actornithophilus grandiceps]
MKSMTFFFDLCCSSFLVSSLIILSISCLFWIFYTKNNLINLSFLLLVSFLFCFLIWEYTLSLWPILIYLIPTSTGLYILFSYIVSVDWKMKIKEFEFSSLDLLKMFLILLVSIILLLKILLSYMGSFPLLQFPLLGSFLPFLHSEWVLMMIVIFLILFIIFMIWMINSKGGGAREA